MIQTSRTFETFAKVSRFRSQLIFPFPTVNFNEECSSLRSSQNATILAFF